jgi:nicotinate-nucleotide pyrophosphorylase (carboxylating)
VNATVVAPRQPPALPPAAAIAGDVARALAEDVGIGDVTALLLENVQRMAEVVVREEAVIAGQAWFERCFRALDPEATIVWDVSEGARTAPGARVCRIVAQARALVSAERCALNFLQTLSGTATVTRAFVQAVAGTRARILDTRKTLPGLRAAQKYAVRAGGAENHRLGLYDAFLIKENHVVAAGGIAAAVARARGLRPDLLLEVEVESLAELEQALDAAADRILLDDFSSADLRQAVARSAGRCALEVSGGVTLESVRAIAETGVDFISIGALTKHLRAIDFSLRVIG